jgi:uncharacterized peroxidase-related enzyme
MRIKALELGQSFKFRAMFKVIGLIKGTPVPDMLKVVTYRPSFFGKPMGLLHNAVLRRPSEWTIGERELFAAWVSEKNRCQFCITAHRAIAESALASALPAALTQAEPSQASEKARAMLPFLEKLTLAPDEVTKDDLQELRAQGVSKQALRDAIYICAMFCVMNRVADAFGCEPYTEKQAQVFGKLLHEKGYDL